MTAQTVSAACCSLPYLHQGSICCIKIDCTASARWYFPIYEMCKLNYWTILGNTKSIAHPSSCVIAWRRLKAGKRMGNISPVMNSSSKFWRSQRRTESESHLNQGLSNYSWINEAASPALQLCNKVSLEVSSLLVSHQGEEEEDNLPAEKSSRSRSCSNDASSHLTFNECVQTCIQLGPPPQSPCFLWVFGNGARHPFTLSQDWSTYAWGVATRLIRFKE